jgi:hypothetical protein
LAGIKQLNALVISEIHSCDIAFFSEVGEPRKLQDEDVLLSTGRGGVQTLNAAKMFDFLARLGGDLNNISKVLYPSPDRPIASEAWFLPLTQAAFIISSTLSRSSRIKIATPVLLLLLSHTRSVSTGDNPTDYIHATIIFGFVLKYIDFGLLLKDGEVWKLKHREATVHDSKNGKSPEIGGAEKRSIWKRFKDSCELWLFTARGIGWNWEVDRLPVREKQSREYFLFRTFLRIVCCYLLLDVCTLSLGMFPYIQAPVRGPFFDQPFVAQVILTWLHQLGAFVYIDLPYTLAAFLAVATSFQDPSSWPPMFGNLSDAYLVSRAWGRTWHRLLHRPFGILTPHMQRWLGATSRGSKRTISLACSFALSGLLHWSGALNVPWAPNAHGMLTYFMMQVPVIRAEDLVVDFAKAKGIKGRNQREQL